LSHCRGLEPMPLPFFLLRKMPYEKLPEMVVIDLTRAFDILDQLAGNNNLPIIDVEALMSQILEGLENPHRRRVRQYIHLLDGITSDIFRIAEPEDFDFNYAEVRYHLDKVCYHVDRQLRFTQLYVRGMLPYTYVKRRARGYALLRRQRLA
jgi:hypothetical protein